ncbi:MAG: hypothetical protein ACFCU6_01700 [Balneolaceae bacterium]
MKILPERVFYLVLMLFIITGCSGDRGPVGPEGPPGPEILPISFEFEADLLIDNDFEFFSPIPDEIEVFDSDVMLAFVLEDFIEEDDLEVWRQLPITDFNNRGTRIFTFDFTLIDIRIFLDANYILDENDEFFGVLIRAVHVPADFIQGRAMSAAVESAGTLKELQDILGTEIKQLPQFKGE